MFNFCISKMEINQRENELHLYPINKNEYLGAINVNGSNMRNAPGTTIILDQSESMGSQVPRFVRQIIPLVMSKLGYAEDYSINLISFATITTTHYLTSKKLKTSHLASGGKTFISPGIAALREILEQFESDYPGVPMRVLTISDGEVSDAIPAANETKKLIEYLAGSDLTINSQAVRLFTSSNQPDTKALSYLLQINNCTTTQLYDATTQSSNETIANEIVKLFQKDCFHSYQLLSFERSIVLKFPWNSHASMRVILQRGSNIFWLKQVPSGVKLGNDAVKVIVQNELSLGMYYELMESKLEYIADHMIILKVVGTPEASGTVDQIFTCLRRQEQALASKSSSSNNRLISNLLDGIAKNKTNFHNSKQMAEFLRNTKVETEKQRETDRKKREEEKARIKKEKEAEDVARLRKKREDEEAAALIKKQKDEKEKADRIKKEKEAGEACIKKEKEDEKTEALIKKQKDEMEKADRTKKEKEADEARTKREKEDAEASAALIKKQKQSFTIIFILLTLRYIYLLFRDN